MKLTILYDNYGFKEGMRYGWGFSAYIEHRGKRILFDFGEAWEPLKENMLMMVVDPSSIDIAVLSHDHWDHNGGMEGFLSENDEAELYLPADFNGREVFNAPSWKDRVFGREAVFVKDPIEIDKGVYSSGSLNSSIGLMEQAIGVETEKGILAIVGCSHPSVDALVESLRRFGDVYGVIGGFHGFSNLDYLSNFELIVPTHCTKLRDEILGKYKAVEGGSGFQIEI